MFRRVFERIRSITSTPLADRDTQTRPALMENLEGRALMSITVDSIVADNRGKVLVILNPGGGTIDATTITKTSCLL